jgi:drug/metabolite transporter (DMT)-like permease
MLLQGDGLQFTSASTSAFLTQFYALLIPLWLAWRTRRNPGRWVWASAALVLAGVAILGEFDWRTFRMGRGEAETLLASVFFMGQILTLERPEYANNRVVPITLLMFLVQGLVFLVLALGTAPSLGAMLVPLGIPAWWALSVALVVLCTLGSFLLMNRWQREISSTEAGMLYCIEPVFASALALVLPVWLSRWAGIDYPNEVLGTHLLLGGGLILAANVLLQLRPPPPVND